MKKSISIFIMTLVLWYGGGGTVFSAESCEITAPAGKDISSLSLADKKEILSAVIVCSMKEISYLRASIDTLKAGDKEMDGVRDRLVERLDSAYAYYKQAKTRADGVDAKGLQLLAKEIKDKRASFAPLAQESINWVIWTRNQKTLDESGLKIESIRGEMKEAGINGELEKLLNQSEANLAKALQSNTAAKALILKKAPTEDVYASLKPALELLTSAYNGLIELGEKIEK